ERALFMTLWTMQAVIILFIFTPCILVNRHLSRPGTIFPLLQCFLTKTSGLIHKLRVQSMYEALHTRHQPLGFTVSWMGPISSKLLFEVSTKPSQTESNSDYSSLPSSSS